MKRIVTLSMAMMAVASLSAKSVDVVNVKAGEMGSKPSLRASRVSRSAAAAARAEMQTVKMDPMSFMSKEQKSMAAALAPKPGSLENNLYYSKPAGAMYFNFDAEFSGYYPTIVSVAPFYEFSFVDQSTPAAMFWTINDQDVADMVEDGALTTELEYGYGMPCPVISNRKGSFVLGEGNEDSAQYPSRIAAWGDYQTLGFVDDHTGYYAWGSLDNDNLYGTGNLNGNPTVGIIQDFPKPATPLYCESVLVPAIVIGETVGTIYIDIFNLEDEEAEEPVYHLVATDDDIVFDQPSTRNGKSIRFTKLQFNNVVIDEDGFESQEPFVLDFASEIVVTWDEGSDFGGFGLELQPEDMEDFGGVEDTNAALFAVQYPEGVKYHYYKGLAFYISFTAYQDNVVVPTTLYDQAGNAYTECNVVKLSDDGQTAESVNDGWVIVYFADTDLENYSIVSDSETEWFTVYTDTTGMSESSTFYMTFRGEPLPEGVTGRSAELYVQGRGVQSADPIIVYQGEKPTDIAGIKVEAVEPKRVYNLQGILVDNKKLAPGFYISNGQKMVVK